VTALIRLRKQLPALRRGAWNTLLTDDKQNVYAYLRTQGKQQVLVVINNGEKPASVRLRLSPTIHRLRVLLCSDNTADARKQVTVNRHGTLLLHLPAMSGWVLLAEAPRPSAR
jgi:glycosidase